MTKARLDGLYFLAIGILLFLVCGIAFERMSPASMQDFRVLYNPARCLLHDCDPYSQVDVFRVSRQFGRIYDTDSKTVREIVTRYIYPPTAFVMTIPFALLPWEAAHLLWLGITIVTMVLASLAIWDLGAEAPILAGLMTALVIANCESIVISGNAAGIVDSLCVIAVWCFLRERFVWLGVLSLAMGLLVKPHNTGLIWMCFLLSGGVLRKRALQTLMVTAALGAPCIFWVYHQSPDWPQGLRNNIAVFSEHGGLADPGPACTTANGPGILTNLQAIFSLLRDDPHFYNTATYAACILLFFVWMFVVWRNERTQGTFLVSLAVSSSLSMLPLYHRIYDAKLLLLTIPACTVVWAKNKILRWFALLLNLAALLATADLPQAVLIGEANHLRSTSVVNSRISAAAIDAFPAPLSVALITLFYLGLGLTHSMSLRSRK